MTHDAISTWLPEGLSLARRKDATVFDYLRPTMASTGEGRAAEPLRFEENADFTIRFAGAPAVGQHNMLVRCLYVYFCPWRVIVHSNPG